MKLFFLLVIFTIFANSSFAECSMSWSTSQSSTGSIRLGESNPFANPTAASVTSTTATVTTTSPQELTTTTMTTTSPPTPVNTRSPLDPTPNFPVNTSYPPVDCRIY